MKEAKKTLCLKKTEALNAARAEELLKTNGGPREDFLVCHINSVRPTAQGDGK